MNLEEYDAVTEWFGFCPRIVPPKPLTWSQWAQGRRWLMEQSEKFFAAREVQEDIDRMTNVCGVCGCWEVGHSGLRLARDCA